MNNDQSRSSRNDGGRGGRSSRGSGQGRFRGLGRGRGLAKTPADALSTNREPQTSNECAVPPNANIGKKFSSSGKYFNRPSCNGSGQGRGSERRLESNNDDGYRGHGRGRGGLGRGRGPRCDTSNNVSGANDIIRESNKSFGNRDKRNHNDTQQPNQQNGRNTGVRLNSSIRSGAISHNSRDGRNPKNDGNRNRTNPNQPNNDHDLQNNINNHKTQEEIENRNNIKKNNNTRSIKTENSTNHKSNKSRTKKIQYEAHADLATCLARYTSGDPKIVRGKLRVMPARNGAAFVTCDRGSFSRDVVIKDEKCRNRALDGDYVYVELLPLDGVNRGDDDRGNGDEDGGDMGRKDITIGEFMENLELNDGSNSLFVAVEATSKTANDVDDEIDMNVEFEEEEYLIDDNVEIEGKTDGEIRHCEEEEGFEMWHDDDVQMSLWDPVVNLRKKPKRSSSSQDIDAGVQHCGKVISIIPPKSNVGMLPSELNPSAEDYRKKLPTRTIVGTLTKLPDGKRYLLVPNNKSLPRFMCPLGTIEESAESESGGDGVGSAKTLYRATYTYGSWHATNKWPPCNSLTPLCGSCNVEDETKALLVEFDVDHGEFPPKVLKDVEQSVKSGRFYEKSGNSVEDMGWKPTEEMLRGRRDYRNHRVFTIDPTTARDLDDALHITPLPDGRVEIGVHIADVSHFIQPDTAVDQEALRRATTVYLVDRVIPMLPRPLCEIACSLNENVERLAFSVVWRMNMDGTLSKRGQKEKCKNDEIWYGRTVIKSCSRLDYATAQNIIDGKVATGERAVDETLWPKSRQPTGGHTIDEVAADVRLMHKVAMARRKLRFENGALALNGIKLTFQLEEDGETPRLCAPYPIRDSNRLIEEFMLLANYLVAQRLITHAHGRALLRNHSPPIELGLQNVVEVSKASFNFDIDITSSQSLQESLNRLCRECDDELVVQSVTESLMTPFKPAEYIAAGELDEAEWRHFALNIPYYTHFTSPIRRYPDVVVHRLLQATLDDNVDEFPQNQSEIHAVAGHCNDKRMAAKKAQERSDRVFLSLYLKSHPISSVLGVCLSVGEKTFTVFVPSLGMSTRVFLEEHEDVFDMNAFEDSNGKRKIVIRPKTNVVPWMQCGDGDDGDESLASSSPWKCLEIGVFTKLEVSCFCKAQPPIDVKVKVVGPWKE
ncbi:hypothetical protein ACHAXS_009760 [Conticribra weissflogii]